MTAIKANWADYYAYLGRSPAAEFSVGPYLTWLLTGVPDSFLNVIFHARLPADGAGAIIDEALAHFRSRGVRGLSWWAETNTPATDLGRQLISHGLTFDEGGTGMAIDLTALPADPPIPPGLAIVTVDDPATLRQWIHVCRIGFGIPEHAESRLYDLFAGLAAERPVQCQLAVLDGRPVGTVQLFPSTGVAGIYNVTCLPDARRQGIGAAVTWAALVEARRLSYGLGVLQASSQGYDVYRRLGFRDYGKLNVYLWENHSE